jgi:hypothetical protein
MFYIYKKMAYIIIYIMHLFLYFCKNTMQSLFELPMAVIINNLSFIYTNLFILNISLLYLLPFIFFDQLTNHFLFFI